MTARIGITMGDPSGIGPEIIVKTLAQMSPATRSVSAVVGNLATLQRADKLLGTGLKFVDGLDAKDGEVPVVNVESKDQDKIVDGKVSAAGGEAAYRYVEEAVKLALARQDRGDRHGAAEQGRHAFRRPSLRRPYRVAGAPDRGEVFVHAAGERQTERDPRHDAPVAEERRRTSDHRKGGRAPSVPGNQHFRELGYRQARASRSPA